MKLFTFAASLLFLNSFSCLEKARFDFYRLYEVTARNENHLKLFLQILDYPDGYRFMTNSPSVIDSRAQLIVPPHKFGEWSELVEKFKLDVILLTENLQDLFDKEEKHRSRRKSLDWSTFWSLNEIHEWMEGLASSRPNDISIFNVGTSYEGRQMKGLKINIGGETGKKSIFFESNIHANEWIGAATTTYIINELLTSSDANVLSLLQRFEWWFLPVFNVDGYIYTWSVDRTWRKTRRPNQNLLCHGADPNRNWDVVWGTFGGSSNPCSTGYYGDFVFSEPETKQLSQFLETIPDMIGYISFHSFGRLLMTPYAFTRNQTENISDLNAIGAEAVNTIFSFRGSTYQLGSISDFFNLVAGSSVDYVAINQSPKIVYCYELSTNHILPPEEIQQTGQEIYASVIKIFTEAVSRGIA